MLLLKISFFFLPLFFYCFKLVHLHNEQKCGKYAIEKLQKKTRYISYDENKQSAQYILTSGVKDYIGSFGAVSIGFVRATDDGGPGKCVAVKFLEEKTGESEPEQNDGDLKKYYTKSIEVAKRIERLNKKKRRHLIQMIDAGVAKKKDGSEIFLIIMEMGTEFTLYNREKSYENDHQWAEMIAKLAQPLVEFHQIAIHMDIKASNYLYVSEKGEKVLKLIDYDGAQLIDSPNKNATISPQGWVFTEEYCAPEIDREIPISRKFDIWSLGMMVYEAFIDKLRAENEKHSLELDDLRRFLTEIRNLNAEESQIFKMANKSSGIESVPKFDDQTWERHNNVIDIVLRFWRQYPKTAVLVTNMLHPTSQQRVTAKGILDYLTGLCCIQEFKWARTAEKLRIFNYLKFGQLKKKIVRRQRVLRLKIWKKDMMKPLKEKYAKMKRTVNEIIREQQEEMDGLIRSERMRNCESE